MKNTLKIPEKWWKSMKIHGFSCLHPEISGKFPVFSRYSLGKAHWLYSTCTWKVTDMSISWACFSRFWAFGPLKIPEISLRSLEHVPHEHSPVSLSIGLVQLCTYPGNPGNDRFRQVREPHGPPGGPWGHLMDPWRIRHYPLSPMSLVYVYYLYPIQVHLHIAYIPWIHPWKFLKSTLTVENSGKIPSKTRKNTL